MFGSGHLVGIFFNLLSIYPDIQVCGTDCNCILKF